MLVRLILVGALVTAVSAQTVDSSRDALFAAIRRGAAHTAARAQSDPDRVRQRPTYVLSFRFAEHLPYRCDPVIRCEFCAPNGPKGSLSAAEPQQIMVRVARP